MRKAIMLSVFLLIVAASIAHANMPPVDEPRGGTIPQIPPVYRVYLPIVGNNDNE